MADELIDIFDANQEHIGTAMKSEAHKKGLWHKSFLCWIVKKDKDGDKIWLQLRSKSKVFCSNVLDVSVAGHIGASEDILDAGVREIEEEVGLKVQKEDLFYLGYCADVAIVNNNTFFNNEFIHTYFLETDEDITNLKPQPEELDGIFEIKISDLKKLFVGDIKEISISGLRQKEFGVYEKETINVNIDNFTTFSGPYMLKIAIMAELFCNGERKYLAV